MNSNQQDVYSIIKQSLDQYGLGSLAGVAHTLAQRGQGLDAINAALQQQGAWKQRFAGNAAREKAGLAPLSPGDYIQVENQYAEIMRQAGLPAGYINDKSRFTGLIGNNVSASELSSRVGIAQQFLNNADPNVTNALKNEYGLDRKHLLAHVLDPDAALPLLQKQAASVMVGAEALRQHVNIGGGKFAEQLVDEGVTQAQARQAFSQVATEQKPLALLGQMGGTHLTTGDLANDALGLDAKASAKIKTLKDNEAARFAGNTGARAATFAANDAGSY